MTWVKLLLFGVLASMAAGVAQAHVAQVSSSRVRVADEGVIVELKVNAADLEAVLGRRLREPGSGLAEPGALAAAASEVSGYLAGRTAVAIAGGGACPAEPGTPRADAEHVLLTIVWRCPSGASDIVYRAELFHELDRTARHVVLLDGEDQRQALLDAETPEIALTGASAPSWGAVVLQYLVAGIEHILIGYDHIAFLLAVILWGRRLWPLVKVVTAFTVGHSITLSLAVLDIVVLPSTLVEAAIAASIVYVAVENFFVREIDQRWRVTGLLGLVHGLGFAGVLKEYGLPSDALAIALAAFNIGVEIGQVAIVALAVPLLLLGDRLLERRSRGAIRQAGMVYAGSVMIAALGLYWLAERIVTA